MIKINRVKSSDNLNFDEEATYVGERKNGLKHGKGLIIYPNGKYEGDWYEDEIHGHGKLFYEDGKILYDGQWKKGMLDGYGMFQNFDPTMMENFNFMDFNTIGESWVKYEGNFRNNGKHGLGTVYLVNGDKFFGHFQNDKLNGQGSYYKSNGEIICGKWIDNVLIEKV